MKMSDSRFAKWETTRISDFESSKKLMPSTLPFADDWQDFEHPSRGALQNSNWM